MAQEQHSGIAHLELLERGAAADHDLAPRHVEVEEGFDILLDRHAPDVEQDRPRQAGHCRVWGNPGIELVEIDAERPMMGRPDAARLKLIRERLGDGEGAFRGAVEAPTAQPQLVGIPLLTDT